MRKDKIYEELKVLYDCTKEFEDSRLLLDLAKSEFNKAKEYHPCRLEKFDVENKEKFIVGFAGESPKPNSKLNPLNYTFKRKEAEKKAFQGYFEQKARAEEIYYDIYRDERNAFDLEDKADKEEKILKAKTKLAEIEEKVVFAKERWSKNTLLSERLRNTKAISDMMRFYEDGRVETLKEAINLFYDESRKDEEARLAAEHRKKLEEMIERQNESIKYAVETAESASSQAQEAYERAEEAYERADEAYDMASDDD